MYTPSLHVLLLICMFELKSLNTNVFLLQMWIFLLVTHSIQVVHLQLVPHLQTLTVLNHQRERIYNIGSDHCVHVVSMVT